MALASSPVLRQLMLVAVLAAAAAPLIKPCSAVDPITTYCASNFTGSPQKQSSIDQVLSALVVPSSRQPPSYYTTASAGHSDSAVWGLAQCRGDVPASDCRLCLSAARRQLASACRGSADARVWYDYCFMRYDDADFRGLPDTGYTLILLNTMNASGDPAAFDRAERKLMSRVAREAGAGGDGGGEKGGGVIARETARLDDGATTVYGLGWCTGDITAADCGLCVAQAVAEMPNYCRFRRGCRVLYSSCMARYETYPFFFPVHGGRSSSQDDGDDDASASHAGEYDKVVLNLNNP